MRSKLFERVKYIASKLAGSQAILSEQLGINRRTFEGYFKKERENSLWPLLPQILTLYPQIQRNWLYFGEGEPCLKEGEVGMSVDRSACLPTNCLRPVPMVGLASCGTEGWNTVTTISVSASPIMLGNNAMAVVAAGKSMEPAGIASGQICYCDPDQIPLEGDAIYLLRRDNKATVKLYLGTSDMGNGGRGIRLKGWLHPNEQGKREIFHLDVPESDIITMAPVMYVRRRL